MRGARGLALALALAACGGGASGDDDDDIILPDAMPMCEMAIATAPDQPEAPVTITATASFVGNASGFASYAWTVRRGGADVAYTPADTDESAIQFDAAEPGLYTVTLGGTRSGIECVDAQVDLNVVAPNAVVETFRLRIVPAPAQPAPVQERTIMVSGGSPEISVGEIALDSGVVIDGVVTDAVAAPVAAYLRASRTGTVDPQVIETFSGGDGGFSVRLAAATYDLLVVPDDPASPPGLLAGQSFADLGAVSLPAGEVVSGVVQGPGGAAVAGARVSLRVGGVPSSLAVTDAGGAFAVRAHLGAAAEISVSPPEGSALPALVVPASAGLVPSASEALTLAYDAGLVARQVDLTATDSGGATPVSGARVTWIAGAIAGAGTATSGAGAPVVASGRVRAVATTDGSGATGPVAVPEALYTVLVEPPVGGAGAWPSLTEVDLRGGAAAPAQLSLAEAAMVTGEVVDRDGAAYAGVRVTARPTGVLAGATTAASVVESAGGAFAIPVAAGGTYELEIESTDHSGARVRTEIASGSPGAPTDLGTIEMPPALAVRGRVTIPGVGGGAPGVTVVLLCFDCGDAAGDPIAESVTDATGGFVLAAPDPGLAE